MDFASQIRLIVLDVDGTVLTADGAVSHRVRESVRQALQKGIRVMLATGRMVQSARQIWEELGLPEGHLIAYNGAVIASMPDGAHRVVHHLPSDAAQWLVKEALRYDILTQVYVGKELWVSQKDERVRRYVKAHHIPAWVRTRDEILLWPEPPIKLLLQGESDVLDQFRLLVQDQAQALGVRVFKSQSDYLEMVGQGIGKGPALAQVAEWLDIPSSAVLAVGDAENDIDMLQWAGIGVAMGQSRSRVKDAANWVTSSVDEDGAAVAIDRMALS